MSEYVNFHYMPLEGKITGKQVLKQTEDAINDLGNKVYNLDIYEGRIDEAIEKSDEAINTADAALAAVTTDRAVWKNTVAEMQATNIDLGVTAATRGKMVFNDGSGAFYGVRSEKSGDVESDDTVFLDNGNVAERIQSMNVIAKGNNIIFVANVAELIDSDALIGNVYGTTGYYYANDGGAGLYSIRAKTQSDVEDGGSIIFLENGNVAELICDGTVSVKQFGAKGDGVTNDISAIQKAIAFCQKGDTLYFPKATYFLLDSLVLKPDVEYDFGNSTIVTNASNIVISCSTAKKTTLGISTDYVANTDYLILTDVTGLSVGQLIVVSSASSDPQDLFSTCRDYYYKGGLFIVKAISRTTVYLDHTMPFDMRHDVATVDVYDPHTCKVRNIAEISNADGNQYHNPLRFSCLINSVVDNVNYHVTDDIGTDTFDGLRFAYCYNTLVQNCDIKADVTAKNTYGIQIDSCFNTIVERCKIISQWHCITTGWEIPCVNQVIRDCTLWVTKEQEFAFADHQNAIGTVIDRCVCNSLSVYNSATIIDCDVYPYDNYVGIRTGGSITAIPQKIYTIERCRIHNASSTSVARIAMAGSSQIAGVNPRNYGIVRIIDCEADASVSVRPDSSASLPATMKSLEILRCRNIYPNILQYTTITSIKCIDSYDCGLDLSNYSNIVIGTLTYDGCTLLTAHRLALNAVQSLDTLYLRNIILTETFFAIKADKLFIDNCQLLSSGAQRITCTNLRISNSVMSINAITSTITYVDASSSTINGKFGDIMSDSTGMYRLTVSGGSIVATQIALDG